MLHLVSHMTHIASHADAPRMHRPEPSVSDDLLDFVCAVPVPRCAVCLGFTRPDEGLLVDGEFVCAGCAARMEDA